MEEMQSKKNNKKAFLIAIVVLLIIATMLGGILAYLTDKDEVTNVFTIGNVRIKLDEGSVWNAAAASGIAPTSAQNIEPGQSIEKAPVVQNIGSNPAYIYTKVYVPVYDDGTTVHDLFTYTLNPGWTKRTEELHTTDNKYNIYVYEYDETLQPGTDTPAVFSEVVFAPNINFTPEQAAELGGNSNELNVKVKAYAIQSENGVSKASNEMTTQMTSETGEEEGLVGHASGPNITSAALGQYVSLGTNLLGKDNTTESDWRVFSKDADGAWLILADYLPVTSGTVGASTVSTVGLQTNGTYGVYSDDSREDLITKLNGDWSSLIAGTKAAGKTGVLVKGAVDLPTWVESWNSNSGYTHLYYENITTPDNNNFYATGYGISDSDPVESTYVSVSDNTGYNDSLYFPHQSDVSNCCGYWLASPSAINSSNVMCVYYYGYVRSNGYYSGGYGARPAVYLPSSISLDTTGTVWSIAE